MKRLSRLSQRGEVATRRRPLAWLSVACFGACGYWMGTFFWGSTSSAEIDQVALAEHSRIAAERTDYGDVPIRVDRALEQLVTAPSAPTGVALGPSEGIAIDPPIDEEWGRLPRTGFEFEVEYGRVRHRIDCNKLFRNQSLNPGDQYIPAVARAKLKDLVSARSGPLLQLRQLGSEIGQRELSALIEAGVARGRTYQAYLDSLPADEREARVKSLTERRDANMKRHRAMGLDEAAIADSAARLHVYGSQGDLLGFPAAVVLRKGDRYFGAERNELPGYHANCAMLESELARLASDIIGFFIQFQVLASTVGSDMAVGVARRLHDGRR